MLTPEVQETLRQTMTICINIILEHGDEALAFSAMGSLAHRAEHIADLQKQQIYTDPQQACNVPKNSSPYTMGGMLAQSIENLKASGLAGGRAV